MIKYIRNDNGFIFFKNNQQLFTENQKEIIVKNETLANYFVNEFGDKKKINDQYSNLNLTLFSCNLNKKDREIIISELLHNIDFDIVFYRGFKDSELIQLLNKKLNPYLNSFSKKYDMKIKKMTSIIYKNDNFNKENFWCFLNSIDNFKLTTIYKLSGITKSVILSYFFLKQKISYVELFKLTNIENFFQQKKWGYVLEQKEKDKEILKILKNISIFFKNVI